MTTFLVAMTCRDDHGNFIGEVERVDIQNTACLGEMVMELELCDGKMPTLGPPTQAQRNVVFAGETFPVRSYRTHIGNIFWDGFTVGGPTLIALLNRLREWEGFSCTASWSELFDLWETGRRFTEADLPLFETGGVDEQ